MTRGWRGVGSGDDGEEVVGIGTVPPVAFLFSSTPPKTLSCYTTIHFHSENGFVRKGDALS